MIGLFLIFLIFFDLFDLCNFSAQGESRQAQLVLAFTLPQISRFGSRNVGPNIAHSSEAY
jgi:hypothetical protein